MSILLLAVAVSADVAWADSITLNGGAQTVTVSNTYGSLATQSHSAPSGGSSWDQTTQANDTDRADAYDSTGKLVTSLGQTEFDLDMTFRGAQYRNGSGWGRATAFGTLYFTADEELSYTLSGGLTRTAGSGTLQQRVFLLENGTANYLFNTNGYLSDGSATSLSGSGLTGTLEAGTAYQLYFEYFAGTNTYNGSVAATGGLTLSFSSTSSPVPEPGTLALLGVGLAGMALRRRRLRAA